MLKINNSNQVYLLIITIIFLNFISVGWWTFMEKKRQKQLNQKKI